MSWLPESKDHLPLTWWKGNPIYLSAILALAGVASMIVTAILGPALANYLVFTFEGLTHFRLWTPVTYIVVNWPSIWILLGCFMLWRFGEAVERHLGRRSFVRMLVILLFVSPVLVSLAAFLGSARGCSGMMELEFGVFIAFATLYPRAQISLIFFTLEVWVIAAAIVSISALSSIASRDWISLIMLAGQVGTAIAYIRYEQGALKMPDLAAFKPTPPKQSLPRMSVGPAPTRTLRKHSPAVDDILEKISREGMHSLTEEERRILDKASEDLQKKKP